MERHQRSISCCKAAPDEIVRNYKETQMGDPEEHKDDELSAPTEAEAPKEEIKEDTPPTEEKDDQPQVA
jgi:hypothetical protein